MFSLLQVLWIYNSGDNFGLFCCPKRGLRQLVILTPTHCGTRQKSQAFPCWIGPGLFIDKLKVPLLSISQGDLTLCKRHIFCLQITFFFFFVLITSYRAWYLTCLTLEISSSIMFAECILRTFPLAMLQWSLWVCFPKWVFFFIPHFAHSTLFKEELVVHVQC